MRHGMARHIEPLAAAFGVNPAFEMDAFGVLAHEQILRPVGIGHLFILGCGRADNMSFMAIAEFMLVASAAIRAVDKKHGLLPQISVSDAGSAVLVDEIA